MTVRDALNRGDQNSLGALHQLSRSGDGLALIARTFEGTVTTNVLTLPSPAVALLAVYSTAGTLTGHLGVAASETTPATGNAAINDLGNVEFAGADAVTSAKVVYIAHEGDTFSDLITVAADGTGTLLNGRNCAQVLTAVLDDAATSGGAKTVIERGNAAPAAGQFSVQDDGNAIAFNGTDVGASPVTAVVTYIAVPGSGTGTRIGFGDRLDADYPFGIG